ncbi:MAG: ATP-binding cassette domain-containing protein, partial [Thermoplasmatales archaeon]
SGSVFFEGREITGLPVYERVRLGIARTFQLVSVFDSLTVFENVVISILRLMNTRSMFSGVFFQSTSNRNVVERSKEILEGIGLYSKAEAEVRELSYGEKRMLEIALVLAQNPRILLLDEPFAGLSDYEIRKVSELIEKIKRASTLVVIEHKISKLIGIVDRLAVLNEGSLICEGEPQKVLSDENVRACYWGKEDSFCSA